MTPTQFQTFCRTFATYKIEFPSMAECHKAIQNSKFTIPAAENETTLAFICVPKQEINREIP